jgi:hypothetical protein
VVVLVRCLRSRLRGQCLSSRYEARSFHPGLIQHHILSIHPGVRSVPCLLVMSMYPAYHIRHSNLILLVSSTRCFYPYMPVVGRKGVVHQSVHSFPNKIPHLSSICGVTAELEDTGPIVNTPTPYSWHANEIYETKRFWPEEHRKTVKIYDTTQH